MTSARVEARSVRWYGPPVDRADDDRRGERECQPDDDEREPHDDAEQDAEPEVGRRQGAHDHLQLESDEHEEGAVEDVGGQRPERACLIACLGAGHPGAPLAMSSPHTTTASTPEAWTSSAARNARNGVMIIATLLAVVMRMRRRYDPSTPTARPIATPPTYETASAHVTDSGVNSAAPAATLTARPKITSAVPSLMRLSARSTVRWRSGSPAREAAHRGGVGGGERGSHHERDDPRHPEPHTHAGDREGRDDHEQGAVEHDHPDVAAGLAQRRRDALPEQDRGEEQQQHRLGRQLRRRAAPG